jgi:excisionase family DNA binding protein
MARGFLTIAEIADWLKVDPRVVRNLIDLGVLPAVRMESHEVRVKTADLERFVATVTRWQLEDEAETGQLRVAAHEDASGRERFARTLAEMVRAAASLDQSGLSAALRALGAAAQEFADELDAADAPTRPTTS